LSPMTTDQQPGNVTSDLALYGYWRSSSSYRIRIALNLKGLDFENRPVHLVRDGGEQHQSAFRELNPLGLVPVLMHSGHVIAQSMAICEYLEDVFPEHALLPGDALGKARVRGIAQSITSEIQPLNNLAVMKYLENKAGQSKEEVTEWIGFWLQRGFSAVETWLQEGETGRFCHGDQPGLADCFLVPQVYNAERYSCDLEPYPNIRRISAYCRALPAFINALPENQPDAP
jgi:maleylacetoacetate isomerase